jgi:hypothetical protein
MIEGNEGPNGEIIESQLIQIANDSISSPFGFLKLMKRPSGGERSWGLKRLPNRNIPPEPLEFVISLRTCMGDLWHR